MSRLIISLLVLSGLGSCQTIDLKETCRGEWGYMVGDTAYCELLIDEAKVYSYHYQAPNSYSYSYEIKNDTFYLYGNQTSKVESSPIQYLGKDAFQIMGITPSTLHRISYEEASPYSLANYHQHIKKLIENKTITQIYEQRIFTEMEEAKKRFETKFEQRRNIALYKLKQAQGKK
ncbi:hypothetical protein [Aureispira anguillae]|uniref:Lipoprotein n=1 Tax=Aureispira anguillae TaxID=2864201 RepID=A0A915YC44_9BACT|nr:hypothetical protein [Aureispira anguillae]BDS10336.1 hypothetical protein AsAng_0010440 [Aureispira anguillae]